MRAWKLCIQQAPDSKLSAVHPGVNIEEGEIESRMHPDRKCQATGAAQCEGDENRQQGDGCPIFPTFVRFGVIVQRAETDRLQYGGRPEANAIGQGIHEISAEQDLFAEANEQVNDDPEACEFRQLGASVIQSVYAITATEKD